MTITKDEADTLLAQADQPDKNSMAHIVLVPEGEKDKFATPQAYVMAARVMGFPITALCGFVWVPRMVAEGLVVCPECRAIFENDPNGFGDRDALPEE